MSLQFGAVSLYCVDTVEGAVLRCTQTRNVERPVPLLVSFFLLLFSIKKREFFGRPIIRLVYYCWLYINEFTS